MNVLTALILVAAAGSARAQVVGTAFIANDVAGNVQSGRLGVGAAAAYYPREWIGLELDGELHGHFFRDEDVAALQPAGVDLNTSAALATGNVVVPYCFSGAKSGAWCPYATLGLGVIHAKFAGAAMIAGATGVDLAQTNFALDAGLGVMHQLTEWIGLRVDARYLHAFVDESSRGGGYFKDYGYVRVSVGVIVGFPR